MTAPWLTELPHGWREVALRYLARVETGSRDTVDAVPGAEFPFIVRSPKPLEIDTYSYDTEAVLTAGDGAVGEVFHHVKGKFEVHQRVYVMRDFRGLDGRFFFYYFSSQFGQTVAYGGAQSTVASLRRPMFTGFPVAVPPIERQRAIADYLDRETAQIDAFIAKNEALIALLTERRTAVIELAIRDSAKATATLGVLLRGLKDGTHGSFERVESVHPLLGARNIQARRLVLDGQESSISEADHSSIVANGYPRRGDVLLVIVGATIGKSAVYDRTEPLAFQRSVAFLRPGRLLSADFLWYCTQTRAFQDEVWLRAKVSAQPGLYLGDVANIPILLPDVETQRTITARLDRDVVAIEEAIVVAKKAIELARERRAGLISAAVTGKIDIRKSA